LIRQFIRDIERTSGIVIKDWMWVLEWHKNGAPHWHVFIETQEGKAGMIGNKILIKHWKNGIVRESYIKSEKHWKKFTSYFGANGYFAGSEKDKSHQTHLPQWANSVTYQIRKTGGKCKRGIKNKDTKDEKELQESDDKEPVSYKEILSKCGQSVYCQIRRGNKNLIWAKIMKPYREILKLPGEYLEGLGYFMQMKLGDFIDKIICNQSVCNANIN